MKKTIEIDLIHTTVKATITIKSWGQEDPSKGDRIQVKCEVRLPHNQNFSKELWSDLQFGNRVSMCDESLHSGWGDLNVDDGRYHTRYFLASKWAEAFADAESWAMAEVAKLNTALAARKFALDDASKS